MNTDKQPDVNGLNRVTTYHAGVVQATVHRMLQKRCDEILEPYGITKNQWLIIGTVLDAGEKGARISELAETLGTTLPYLTNAINLLESKDMLTRKVDTSDTRSKYVSVNPRFVPKTKEIERTLREGLRESVYSHIAVEDFRTYMKVLYQLQGIGE